MGLRSDVLECCGFGRVLRLGAVFTVVQGVNSRFPDSKVQIYRENRRGALYRFLVVFSVLCSFRLITNISSTVLSVHNTHIF